MGTDLDEFNQIESGMTCTALAMGSNNPPPRSIMDLRQIVPKNIEQRLQPLRMKWTVANPLDFRRVA